MKFFRSFDSMAVAVAALCVATGFYLYVPAAAATARRITAG
jgi:hypothetical protein